MKTRLSAGLFLMALVVLVIPVNREEKQLTPKELTVSALVK